MENTLAEDALKRTGELSTRLEALFGTLSRKRAETAEAVLEALGPFMPLFDVPIVTAVYQSGNPDDPWVYEHLDEPGIVLYCPGGRSGQTERTPYGKAIRLRGEYEEVRTVFTRSGRLLSLYFVGAWSDVRGEPCRWKAEVEAIPRPVEDPSVFCPEDLLRDLEAIGTYVLMKNAEEASLGVILASWKERQVAAQRERRKFVENPMLDVMTEEEYAEIPYIEAKSKVVHLLH